MLKVKISKARLDEIRRSLNMLSKDLLKAKSATVGIHKDAGQVEKESFSYAELAATLNYGNERIPGRPFLNEGVLHVAPQISDMVKTTIGEATKPSEIDPDTIAQKIGEQASAGVKDYMVLLKSPPNAGSTIRKKKSANPLIDKGLLLSKINYEVV